MIKDETKICPKCNGKMTRGRRLFSFTEITLGVEDQYTGDRVLLFCCENCGYIELYSEQVKGKTMRYLQTYMDNDDEF